MSGLFGAKAPPERMIACAGGAHRRASKSIAKFGNTWRASCAVCGVELVRTSPKHWREFKPETDAPAADAAPAVAAMVPEQVSSADQRAVRLTAAICKLQARDSAVTNAPSVEQIIGIYSACLSVLQDDADEEEDGSALLLHKSMIIEGEATVTSRDNAAG